ncbi:hypothetical protein H1235_08430 [Pseudoxanthomonas sp. NC8]|nr:hypothetical protein H1235_08430 [Pseudoxanthomonas sp. NC8]
MSEHGNAWTLALNWRPQARLRLSAEVLYIDSSRNQRRDEGLAARQTELQLQLGARVFF